VLPTVGGQTALNLAVALHERGILEKYNVKLIGASIDAIKVAEDRLLFRNAMREIGVEVPRSGVAETLEEALALVDDTGFPAIIRPSFTMGGVGGGIAYNIEEFRELAGRGLDLSRCTRSCRGIGHRLEGIRARGDARRRRQLRRHLLDRERRRDGRATPATRSPWRPALTLTDKEYQRMRDMGGASSAASASRPAGRTSSSPSIPTTAASWRSR
jgi:carbamoyl-phosphate synthase large subunit